MQLSWGSIDYTLAVDIFGLIRKNHLTCFPHFESTYEENSPFVIKIPQRSAESTCTDAFGFCEKKRKNKNGREEQDKTSEIKKKKKERKKEKEKKIHTFPRIAQLWLLENMPHQSHINLWLSMVVGTI